MIIIKIISFLFVFSIMASFVLVPVCLFFGSNIITLFISELSNKEFDAMLDLIFSDPALTVTPYRANGGGYDCWIANSYYAFSINNENHFSAWQKIKFYKRLNKHIRRENLKTDNLYKEKLNDAIFTEDLERTLSD